MQSKTKIMLLLVGLQSITAFARPPKVVKMYPENGAPNVKPGPIKIRILFDQDMSSGGHSLCGGGDGFPEIVGKPKWASRRVFVFSAHLEADHDYSFSVNCTSAQNFKSVRGEPAEILFVQFRTAGTGEEPSKSASSETKSHNQQAVQNLRGAIDNAYSYKDLKGIDWEKLFNRYSKSLSNAANAKDFAKNAALMLAHAKDKHIWLKANGEHISVYRNPVTPNANLKLLPKLVPDFKKHNANVSTGRFADGIGYIYIDSWSRHEIKDFDQLYTALKKFSDAPGLIIDVRGNGGGSETIAAEFAGCFIDEPKLYAKHVYRDTHSPSGFGKNHDRILKPNNARPQYRGKIIVLSGPVVMSSCEAFVLMMKQVPGCKIIGGPTQGSSGNPKPHDLGNGVTVYLPSWKAMLPDGTCFEGKGIMPDIPVIYDKTSHRKKDPVIERALKELMR